MWEGEPSLAGVPTAMHSAAEGQETPIRELPALLGGGGGGLGLGTMAHRVPFQDSTRVLFVTP